MENKQKLGCKKVILGEFIEELSEIILDYACQKKMTISNIEEVLATVIGYMEDNATMTDDTHAVDTILTDLCSDIHDIYAALAELYKVTDNTSTQYAQFLKEAPANAKECGSTIKDYISFTADFAKLRYSLQESSILAKLVNFYKNTGDISVEEGVTSTKFYHEEGKEPIKI